MIDLLCLGALAAVVVGFFLLARGGVRSLGAAQTVLKVLVAAPLFVSGVAHLAIPGAMAAMVPPIFPAKALLVILSGIAELAGGAGLFLRRTEQAAALSIALLMIAVFPANIYIAGRTVHGLHMPGVPARLLMQAIYIAAVLAAGWGRPVLRRAALRRPV